MGLLIDVLTLLNNEYRLLVLLAFALYQLYWPARWHPHGGPKARRLLYNVQNGIDRTYKDLLSTIQVIKVMAHAQNEDAELNMEAIEEDLPSNGVDPHERYLNPRGGADDSRLRRADD